MSKPTIPQNFEIDNDNTGFSAIVILWDILENITYEISRSKNKFEGYYTNFISIETSPYIDECGPNRVFWYRIRAKNQEDEYSDWSSPIQGYTVPITSKPNSILQFSASQGTFEDHIDLTWTVSNTATGYFLYMSLDADTGYRRIANIEDPLATTYIHNCGENKVFYYQISAYNNIGESDVFPNRLKENPDEFVSGFTKIASEIGFNVIIGQSRSFHNTTYCLLKSAINARSNAEEDVDFSRPYKYIDKEDFRFSLSSESGSSGTGSILLSAESFLLYSSQKSSLYFEGESSISDISSIGVEFMSESDIDALHTSLIFPVDIFDQKISVDLSYPVVMPGDTPEITRTENFSFANISHDVYKDSIALMQLHGSFFNSKVIRSTGRKIVLEGNLREHLLATRRFAIFHYKPNKIKITYSAINYRNVESDLIPDYFSSTGTLWNKPLTLPIRPNEPTYLNANYMDSSKSFGGITKNVKIGENSLFFYTGVQESNIATEAFVALDDNVTLEQESVSRVSLPIGGVLLNNINIPAMFLDKILYLFIKTSVSATKVIVKLFDEIGLLETIEENIQGKAKYIEHTDTSFEIRIDQSQYSYKYITISFVPQS